MNTTLADCEAVESVLKRIVAASHAGNLEELKKCFHGNMVIEGPEFRERMEGREQCVRHHEEFHRNVKIRSFKASDYQVKVWEDTAVASCHFEGQIETEGRVFRDAGRDLYVFSRRNGEWQAIWNSVIQYKHGP